MVKSSNPECGKHLPRLPVGKLRKVRLLTANFPSVVGGAGEEEEEG